MGRGRCPGEGAEFFQLESIGEAKVGRWARGKGEKEGKGKVREEGGRGEGEDGGGTGRATVGKPTAVSMPRAGG